MSLGGSARLTETAAPGGARGGIAFATQPTVQILDAGGNVVTDDNVTLVTASIEKDDTIRMKVFFFFFLITLEPSVERCNNL